MERAKRKRVWKSPHARKARRRVSHFSRGSYKNCTINDFSSKPSADFTIFFTLCYVNNNTSFERRSGFYNFSGNYKIYKLNVSSRNLLRISQTFSIFVMQMTKHRHNGAADFAILAEITKFTNLTFFCATFCGFYKFFSTFVMEIMTHQLSVASTFWLITSFFKTYRPQACYTYLVL